MTLAKRMTLKIVTFLAMLFCLVGSAVSGLLVVQKSVKIARIEYLELRMISTLDEHLSGAKIVIETGANPQGAVTEFAAASSALQTAIDFQTSLHGGIDDPGHEDDVSHEHEELEYLRSVEAELSTVSALLAVRSGEWDAGSLLAALARAQETLKWLATETDETIAAAHLASKQSLRKTLTRLVLVSLAMIGTAVGVSISHYRSVVIPIRRLRDGVKRIASGQFDLRLEVTDADEYAHLATDFNQMAAELQSTYGNLERRVREKSRVLARSERLASVGFLAAGVAHQINNPLGIITGYAELTLRRLHKQADAAKPVDVEEALRIMRDEAFRCKDIIEKLLSLSAGRAGKRERVGLDWIADDVATIVGSLAQYRGRCVSVDCDRAPHLDVLGNEAELKQVVLNLAINALDAVESGSGEVRLEGRRRDSMIELVVSDNGRGMTSEACDQVFEPFYTQKSGTSGRGLGLGLSIAYAIIESHGGCISATSDGPNQGSQFLVELPPYTEDLEEA